MAQFALPTRAGSNAVNELRVANLPHCQPNITLGHPGTGLYCSCEELRKLLMKMTPEASISRGGAMALLLLTGTFAGRVWAKSLHKDGNLTCYTYRKIKDMVNQQPWFCIPLIVVPVINYQARHSWRPPTLTYVMLVGGWMLNTASHVITIATKDDKIKNYAVPISFASLALAGVAAVLAVFMKTGDTTC